MTAEEKIAARIAENGVRIKFVANKAGIPYNRLQPSLKGHRRLTLNEFLAVCAALDVNPMDYRPDAS